MFSSTCKDWAGCVVVIVLVIGSIGYAFGIGADAASTLAAMRSNTDDLDATIGRARGSVISAGDAEKISRDFTDLKQRLSDSNKQGLIVSQLSESARGYGLKVLEIQPTRPTGATTTNYPIYRIGVEGAFQHISEFMEGFRSLRIPARSVQFSMWPITDGPAVSRGEIRADITVEAFIHQSDQQGGTDG